MKKLLALCSVVGILSLSSCAVNISEINNGVALDCIKKDSETQKVDVNGIEKIEIDIAVGDCNIIAGDSKEAVIKTNCEYKSINEKKAQKALENTELRCETEGDTLYISFIDSETGKKIGSLKNSNLVNIITDIEVTLPDDFKFFDISTDVGDIQIGGFSGAFDISSDVGNIDAKELKITEKSSIDADVGDIDCIAENLDETELELKADVGDVDLSIGKTEKSQVNIEVDVGDISLDTQGKNYEETSSKKDFVEYKKELVIDGDCTINLKTDVGDIKISK